MNKRDAQVIINVAERGERSREKVKRGTRNM